MEYLNKHKSTRIHSTTRTNNQNSKKEGATEWVYTDEILIHEAFTAAKKKYGGTLRLFFLNGKDDETGLSSTINSQFRKDEQNIPHYTGKIVFKM